MSGAEPCTGSNSDGNFFSGFMMADGEMTMVPVAAGPRSERISPNRLEPTTTAKRSGFMMKCAHRMSMWYQSVLTCGYFAAISFTRSSQYGIEIEMPFDLVAEVTCFLGRVIASSNAYLRMRSTPWRENTACCVTNSRSVPAYTRPTTEEHSPSLF